jgi:hypothetical protein
MPLAVVVCGRTAVGKFYIGFPLYKKSGMAKTYNSGDSPMVTHLTTNPPLKVLSYGDRTGS